MRGAARWVGDGPPGVGVGRPADPQRRRPRAARRRRPPPPPRALRRGAVRVPGCVAAVRRGAVRAPEGVGLVALLRRPGDYALLARDLHTTIARHLSLLGTKAPRHWNYTANM